MARTFDRAVSGFNHNINHRGRVFHVQTEDSGVNNPTIVTLLYVGGNILASKKTTYTELLAAQNLGELVRQRMEEQHKEMLRNVVAGKYDGAEASQSARAYQPGQLAEAGAHPAPARADAVSVVPIAGADAAPPVAPVSVDAAPVVPIAGAVAVPPVAPLQRTPIPLLNEAVIIPTAAESLVGTLFGEDLVSEKSLDEVILGYLTSEKEG
jgi:hypothetical protein